MGLREDLRTVPLPGTARPTALQELIVELAGIFLSILDAHWNTPLTAISKNAKEADMINLKDLRKI